MIEPISAKASLRILKFLKNAKKAEIINFESDNNVQILLRDEDGKKILCSPAQLDALHKASLISQLNDFCKLLPLGEKRIKRAEAVTNGANDGGFKMQHLLLEKQKLMVNGSFETVSVNANESPLRRLKIRKGPDGKPWIDDAAYRAGERLRLDFTRGALMQKVTSNWDFSSGSTRSNGNGGKADLSDSAIDARSRLEQALDYVGKDLAGVLTDVCCYLKGLESVEKERRWPPRSAKLMLRIGLGLLACHYGTNTGRKVNTRTHKWGVEGYRPSINT